MKNQQLSDFNQQLLDLKSTLLGRESHNKEALDTVELDQNRMGRLSRMDALQGQQMAQETERRRLLKLKQIEGALQRIKLGDFGFCYVCGLEIQVARLHFDPTLTRCIDCSEVN